MSETIIIPITNARPVRIEAAEWPIIARGDAAEIMDDAVRACAIIVRRHENGHVVAEAALVCDGEEDIVVGWESGDYQKNETLPMTAIRTLQIFLNGELEVVVKRAATAAYNSLPPVDIK